MRDQKRSVVVFPGMFDPITNGHLDIIKRGAKLFDELIIAVGINPDKKPSLDCDTRVELISQVVSKIPNVRVESFTGLTCDFARESAATAILRSLRDSIDLHSEIPLALTNKSIADIETIFIVSAPEMSFVSSSLVKQIAKMGGDISTMVPPEVLSYLKHTK